MVAGLPAGLWLGSVDLLVAAVTALVCVLVLARIGRPCSVTVTEKEVRHRGILGRELRIPAGTSPRCSTPRTSTSVTISARDWLALLDEQDRPLLRLTSLNIWSREGSKQVRKAVGGPTVDTLHMRAATLRLRYPEAMPYRTAHAGIFGGVFPDVDVRDGEVLAPDAAFRPGSLGQSSRDPA